MILRSLISGLSAAAVVLAAGSAEAACQFQKITDVPVTMIGLRPTVMTKINGKDARLLLDTGAFFSGVTPDAVAAYGMKSTVAPYGMMVQGVGGQKRDIKAVAADNFSFAGVGFRNSEFMVIGRIGGDGIVGNIGENLLGPFDVEYDFANGVIRYFKATGCGDANLAYWSQGLSVSRVSLIDPSTLITQVVTNARVDGRLVRVTWDSGAELSVLSRPAAARAGVTVANAGVVSGGVSYGVYGKGLENFLAPFESFKVGDEEIKNTRLRVSDIQLPDSDMLLGADFFLSHRILISNSQKKVYFTYNGGPVFRLDGAAQRQAQAGGPAPGSTALGSTAAAVSQAGAADEPKTAAEFARRGAALAARREYLPAIADYTKAIELEPDDGKHYRARALARLSARQPLLAMNDLNEALKREPNDTEGLMTRGQIFLGMRQPEKAQADFDAAIKLSPADSGLVATAGLAYARAGMYEPAIHALDAWISAHPRSEDLPLALNARCYARGAWGKELELALADCDAALRKDKTSAVMDSRGLVLLRMGRLDEAIAQYAAAIKAQPRAAEPLYGRGLAELKKGQRAEGEADLAAAKAIAPGVEQQFKRFGLAPDGAPAAAPAA